MTQYETDANLAARQRLWATSPRDRDVGDARARPGSSAAAAADELFAAG